MILYADVKIYFCFYVVNHTITNISNLIKSGTKMTDQIFGS